MSEEPQSLEGGAYEVIRARLLAQSEQLQQKLDLLNADRKSTFGAVESSLLATQRITTEHSCTPRDMIAIGKGHFLFAYNIQFGLKQTTDPEDVFSAYRYERSDHTFHSLKLEEIIRASEFRNEFQYLYKYYREATFSKFMRKGPHLYMAFRIGKSHDDIKTFKFLSHQDGTLEYLGNRFDHEYSFPTQHEFEWKRTTRDMQRGGPHPHLSIQDRVFVETVGGDLTVKVEDNTADGQGIYSEPVDDADQTLDDSEIYFAALGPLILLKIRPYREAHFRYLVFNEKNHSVHRIDAIGESCVLLPEDHGIIFANGYYLLTGELKTFDHGLRHMLIERKISSTNGEDTLFAFYNRESGDYALLKYNVIEQQVEMPVLCSGYSIFDNGELIYFKTESEPQKHHVLQIWQTPILSEDATVISGAKAESYLFKVGNPSLVKAMAECRELLTLVAKDDNYAGLYLDLAKRSTDLLDSYFWLSSSEAHQLDQSIRGIQQAAESAISEFDKVQRLRKDAASRLQDVSERAQKWIREAQHSPPDNILGFVKQLSSLRALRGEVIGLRELRYMDLAQVDALEQSLVQTTGQLSQKTVSFLLQAEALTPYRKQVTDHQAFLAKLSKVTEADQLQQALTDTGLELEMLIDVVSNLKIDDSTQSTEIIESISQIYSQLNGIKAELKNRRKELAQGEAVAQFGAQIKLLGQAVVNYLDLCDSPEKTETYLTKLMVQVEELEGRFADFDDYVDELSSKRDEIYNAFETRKQQLLESRNKRIQSLVKSAERVLAGIKSRLTSFTEITAINGYFAEDLMISKVRDVIDQLIALGDSVKADDLQTRLKTIREDAVRSLKDRNELFIDGTNVIQFGKHAFNVNTQPLQLTIVPHEEQMAFHLTGTEFFQVIDNEEFLASKAVWNQESVAETSQVARIEYLVYQFLLHPHDAPTLIANPDQILPAIQAFMQPRYAEAYTKGVHDFDAAKLLQAILPMHHGIGLLRHHSLTRTAAMLFWESYPEASKELLQAKLQAHRERVAFFGNPQEKHRLIQELEAALAATAFPNELHSVHRSDIAHYLFEQLIQKSNAYVVSPEAAEWVRLFQLSLATKHAENALQQSLAPLADHLMARFQVHLDWLRGFREHESNAPQLLDPHALEEAAAHLARGGFNQRDIHQVQTRASLSGLLSDHPRIQGGQYELDYLEFWPRLETFKREIVPAFLRYQELKQSLIASQREKMRLKEFEAKVMSSFVRNKLINNVFLPLIGDNLAKQLGTAGENTRTDRMGLLLLISPPGYGKTTLMEYVAARLGLTFMKINGPALGHQVLSLDPAEAPNASAKEEIHKLNLALEMGDNVMLYLDDIQHTNPEFLQKFISLCDAQRKIEGVFQGKAKTYDLRGKKVAVVMSGNPYTESGSKFQIPDMLANRADTYNLGDIIGGHAEDFKASYIENALTSNPILSKLTSRSQKDVYALMRIAQTNSQEGVDFESNYTPAEIDEMVRVVKHLGRIRDTILRVNLEYIRSAAMEDAYRTEPSFRLQGSYRNMNRIAEKVLPLMTDTEVVQLLVDHYTNEAQTLTTGAEANLLKFKELESIQSPEEAARWQDIKARFNKNKLLGGANEQDPVTRIVAQLSQFNDHLASIQSGLTLQAAKEFHPRELHPETLGQLVSLVEKLRAVPVKVDINLVPTQADSQDSPQITQLEKTSRPPIDIQPTVTQGDPPPLPNAENAESPD